MKKVLCALGLMFTAVSSALATTYPLTIENCGYQETFTRPPERVVALGQNTVEILLLLGLQKQVVASAFWPTSVLPQLAEQNAKIKTLTVEIPSLESVLAQNPDFVPAQLPLLLGPESKVARREDLATVGVNSYVSPGMCATKKATGDMYGSRQKLWDMTWLYQEISDFSRIFNIEDRGQALIADFKKREADLHQEFGKSKKDLSFVFWFSSASPSASETEWPTVSWESIIAANPDVIVVASLDRNRWALDKAEEKIKFLKSDPAVSQLEAVKKGHIVVMDGQAMNPTIRTLYGAEQVGEQLRKMGLN